MGKQLVAGTADKRNRIGSDDLRRFITLRLSGHGKNDHNSCSFFFLYESVQIHSV